MKTLTEFSGTLIRMAARAVAEARSSLPKEAFTSAPAAPSVSAGPTDAADQAAPEAGLDSATDAAAEVLAAEGATAAGDSDAAATAKPGEAGSDEEGSSQDPDAVARTEEAVAGQDLAGSGKEAPAPSAEGKKPQGEMTEVESDAAKTALDEAVGKATGMTGDRLTRLREAVKVAGRQSDRVRLVRVFSGEEPVSGAKKVGEFQYIVDLMPASMKQTFKSEKDEKRGPRGPKKPSGNPKTKEGSLEGSFSMESVMQDRKNERGPGGGRPGGRGGPGGGRGGPGGGRGGPGGGRGGPGGRPGGGGGGRPGGAR